MKVPLGLPAVQPPPAYAEVNAEVEESHGDERGEELQRGGTQQEVPRVIKLCKALVFWYTSSAHNQLPEYDSWSIQDEGQHPDSNHLDHRLMGHALSGTVTYLQVQAERRNYTE